MTEIPEPAANIEAVRRSTSLEIAQTHIDNMMRASVEVRAHEIGLEEDGGLAYRWHIALDPNTDALRQVGYPGDEWIGMQLTTGADIHEYDRKTKIVLFGLSEEKIPIDKRLYLDQEEGKLFSGGEHGPESTIDQLDFLATELLAQVATGLSEVEDTSKFRVRIRDQLLSPSVRFKVNAQSTKGPVGVPGSRHMMDNTGRVWIHTFLQDSYGTSRYVLTTSENPENKAYAVSRINYEDGEYDNAERHIFVPGKASTENNIDVATVFALAGSVMSARPTDLPEWDEIEGKIFGVYREDSPTIEFE